MKAKFGKQSQMEREARQAPLVVAEQLKAQRHFITVAKRIQQQKPRLIMLIARGTSNCASLFAKYLFETYLNIPVMITAPAVFTLYHSQMDLQDTLAIGISQSGASTDICTCMEYARRNHALTIALVNMTDSLLANLAEYVLPLEAGPEKAVAATKSFIASLSALVLLAAQIKQDHALLAKIAELPDYLTQALALDWSKANGQLIAASDLLVIGRGYQLAIAEEAALKFKETTALHAEAYSSAEVMHGPFALSANGMPFFIFAQSNVTFASLYSLMKQIKHLNNPLLFCLPQDQMAPYREFSQDCLPLPNALHLFCDPIIAIQAFYIFCAQFAILRGHDPDHPDLLSKVTITK